MFKTGVLKYSFVLPPEGKIGMRMLAPNDSINVQSTYISKRKVESIVVSFDCILLAKLTKKQRKKFFQKTILTFNDGKKAFRSMEWTEYAAIYTDWFTLNIPTSK